MKKGFIQQLREKPHKTKKAIAIAISAFIAGIVAIGAMLGILVDINKASEMSKHAPVQKGGFFESLKNVFKPNNSNSANTGTSSGVTLPTSTPTSLDRYRLSGDEVASTTLSSTTASTTISTTSLDQNN